MDDAKPPPHVQEVTNQLESRPDESSSLFHDVKSENDHLCWKCRAMFSSIIPTGIECSQETPREGEHPNRTLETTDNLDTTAQRGCPLCQRLMQAMGPPMVQLLRRLAGDELRHSYKIRRKNDNVLNLHLMIRRMYDTEDLSDGHYWIVANLELYQELELKGTMNQSQVDDHTNSKATRTLISGWIAECNTTHDRCMATRKETNFLPSRIINITPGEPIRLVVTSGSISAAPYTTLSHCWGTAKPLRLLLSNLADLQNEISFSDLVKTFQDAIHTSRLLGIYYLWIDSLCIIQDSKQDWEEQSAAMAHVYLNSYCNISAAHAAEGSSGCFTTRYPACVMPLKLEMNWGLDPGIKYPVNPEFWEQNTVQMPLNNRAWVFQERTLAPRNLSFGDTEVLFECKQGRASEQFPSHLPLQIKQVTLRQIQPQVDGPRLRNAMYLEADPSLNPITVWGDFVERFSSLQLTYLSDKLVALSAIASEMQPSINSEYLAGMWREHLPCQLLWNTERFPRDVDFAYPKPVRPSHYVAPSWSWASVHGRVLTGLISRSSENWEVLIDIKEAHVELENPKYPFGQVKSGHIHLMGSLARSVFRVSPGPYADPSFRVNSEFLSEILDDDEKEFLIDGREFYLLPIIHRMGNRRPSELPPGSPQSLVCGLILRRVGLLEHEYVRIGKFEQMFKEEFQSAFRAFAAELQHEKLEKEGWGQRHLITIL